MSAKSIILFISLIFVVFSFSFFKNTKKTNNPVLNSKVINKPVYSNSTVFSENFEGKIYFIQENIFDTNNFIFTIKKNNIRIDKFSSKNKLLETLLFDLSTETITALNSNKKLYYNILKEPYKNEPKNDIKIIKTNNIKNIIGYKCVQWRVRNNIKNTEITYWVTGRKYNFYQKLLKLWNKTNNCYHYFLTIPEIEGYIPLHQVERTLLREIKSTVSVTKIMEQKIDSTTFVIPKNYSLYSN